MGLTLIFMWKWLNTALKPVASFSFNLSIDQKVRRCRKAGRLRAFSLSKLRDWTRSVDTGLPWQNPPKVPIYVNNPIAPVRYIIKRAAAELG